MNSYEADIADGKHSATIMVVEDTPANLRILAEILTDHGYRVRPAVSGPVALSALKHELPDLILLDICMPDMDGYQVCKKLKKNPVYSEIPIIFISALDEAGDILKAFEAGGQDYITKPFHADEVLARIKTHLTINRLKNELKQSNLALEDRVRQRTHSLEKAVKDLKEEMERRKAAEQESERIRDGINNIFNSIPAVLVGINEEGKVIHWNRSAEKQTGIDFHNALGRDIEEIYPRIAGEMERIKKAQTEKTRQQNLKVMTKENGIKTFSDISIYPITGDKEKSVVVVIEDVTERVRLEELMIQSEKMMSVGGLAAGMAHEINNPLAGVIQNVTVLENRLKKDFTPNRKAAERCGFSFDQLKRYIEDREIGIMIKAIEESGNRAADIVKSMLSFSRKSDSSFLPHTMSELLDKTVDLASKDYDLKKTYDFRNIRIKREYDSSVPKVKCEGNKLQQVFLNILKNGAEAMNEPPNPVASPQFILRIIHEPPQVRMEIEDNGPGMPAHVRKRIFEPFFTTKDPGKGTGLGLSVSYFIITENHGGTMDVTSTPGKGTCFIIRIPIERKKDTNHKTEKTITGTLKKSP